MPDRIAFRMNLNPGQAAEYEKRHDEISSSLISTLKEAGISDYTIWLDPEDNHLFGTLVRADQHKLDQLPDTEVVKRWWAFMCDIMECHPNNAPVQVQLVRMFYLP